MAGLRGDKQGETRRGVGGWSVKVRWAPSRLKGEITAACCPVIIGRFVVEPRLNSMSSGGIRRGEKEKKRAETERWKDMVSRLEGAWGGKASWVGR